jgi:hypothetical protein
MTAVLHPLAAILRWSSRIVCLIVIVSFGLFALNQTGAASTHQQEALNGVNGGPTTSTTSTPTAPAHPAREGSVHKAIDEVAKALIAPFSGITASSTSQWVIRGVGTLMALLVYGLGIGYLARTLRVRF